MLSSLDLYLVLETEFLTEPGNLNLTRLASHESPGILQPGPPKHWDYTYVPLYTASFMDGEHPTLVLMHMWQAFYQLRYLFSLKSFIYINIC